MADPQRELLPLEEVVECRGEGVGPGVEALLQPGAVLLEVGEDGGGGGHGHRVLEVGAAEEGGVGGGVAVVAVLPGAAVHPVHDVGAARDGADGEPAAEHLAVRREVGSDAVQLLGSAQRGPEPGEHLVEHQDDAVAPCHLTEGADELNGPQRGVPALHGLDDHRGDPVPRDLDGGQRLRVPVVEDQQVLYGAGRDPGRDGDGDALASGAGGPAEDGVGVPVVGAVEDDDGIPAGGGAGEPDRSGVRLGTRAGERHAVQAREPGQQFGGLAGGGVARPQADAPGQVLTDRLGHELRFVTEEQDSEAHGDVDVLVAVDVLQAGSGGACRRDGVEHLLGAGAEADHGTAVGEHPPVPGGGFLGAAGPAGVAVHELREVGLPGGGCPGGPALGARHHAGGTGDGHPWSVSDRGGVTGRCRGLRLFRRFVVGPEVAGDPRGEVGHPREVRVDGAGDAVGPGHRPSPSWTAEVAVVAVAVAAA